MEGFLTLKEKRVGAPATISSPDTFCKLIVPVPTPVTCQPEITLSVVSKNTNPGNCKQMLFTLHHEGFSLSNQMSAISLLFAACSLQLASSYLILPDMERVYSGVIVIGSVFWDLLIPEVSVTVAANKYCPAVDGFFTIRLNTTASPGRIYFEVEMLRVLLPAFWTNQPGFNSSPTLFKNTKSSLCNARLQTFE